MPESQETQAQTESGAMAAALMALVASMRPAQQPQQSGGFRGTTEGQLTIGLMLLGAVLTGISALAPVSPEISAKLLSMAEQLWTYVPIGYAVSRGLAKGGLPLLGSKQGGASPAATQGGNQ